MCRNTCVIGIYQYNTCIADTCIIHMFYTCNTPKTLHMYYRCGTIGYIGGNLSKMSVSRNSGMSRDQTNVLYTEKYKR